MAGDKKVLGTSSVGLPVNVIDYLSKNIGETDHPITIPINANFVVQFPEAAPLPDFVTTDTRHIEPSRWNDSAEQAKKANDFATESIKLDGLMFATRVSIPGESVTTSRPGMADIEGNISGIILGSPVLKTRNQDQTLSIDFIETESSYVDFIIRPWIIAASHFGLFARDEGSEQNFKRNIDIIWFNNWKAIRKKFRYYNCVPVSLASSDYAYSDSSNVQTVKTTWTYTHYEISSGE